MVSDKYERVEVTFSKTNEKDIQLYEYLKSESEIVGKGRYIKKLINEEMKKNKAAR